MKIACINVFIQKASLKYTCDCGHKEQDGVALLQTSVEKVWKGLAPKPVDSFFQSGWRGQLSWSQSSRNPFQHSALLWFFDLVLMALIEDLT